MKCPSCGGKKFKRGKIKGSVVCQACRRVFKKGEREDKDGQKNIYS